MPWVLRSATIFLGLLWAAVGAGYPASIAVVTDLQGAVALQRAGSAAAVPLRDTTFLQSGDQLVTGSDGRATLFQVHASFRRLSSGQRLTLAPAPRSARTDVLSAELFALVQKQFHTAARSVAQKSGEVRRGGGAGVLTALMPRHTRLLAARPLFEWTPVPGATSYQLTLHDAQEKKLWQATTPSTRADYPRNRRPLAPGDYRWDVIALPMTLRALDSAPFTITTAKEALATRQIMERASRQGSDASITPLPYLAVLLEHRLYPPAEGLLKAATERTPDDRVLRQLLMQLYQHTRRWAERERQRPLTMDDR
jgi:hypothetical protein